MWIEVKFAACALRNIAKWKTQEAAWLGRIKVLHVKKVAPTGSEFTMKEAFRLLL